jgi:hypothetical protein
VCKVINGKVSGVSRLPAISMGRRKLVRRISLEQWKIANETGASDATILASSEIDAVRRVKGEFHA